MEYFNPVKLLLNSTVEDELEKLSPKGTKRAIFCYNGFKNSPGLKKILDNGNDDYLYGNIEENPSFKSIDKALKFAQDVKPEIIVAIGGGSVIDTAKIIRFGCSAGIFSVADLVNGKGVVKTGKKPLFIAVPTTHGTGSEVTMWATVWDKENNRKYSVSDKNNYPDFAVYDQKLFETLPLPVSVSSSLDALSHSFEALWNRNSNPVSDYFAVESIKLIIKNIKEMNDPVPVTVRKDLIFASMYAGLAFSNTKTAAAHSISYPLTLQYGIPHGIACSMPVFPLLKINGEKIKYKLKKLFECCEVKNTMELESKIKMSVKNKVHFRLKDYGVNRNDLKSLVDQSFTKERMANNIVELTKDDVFNVLESIY